MAPVVELLIGLIFLYLILSLVVSAINEGIAGVFGLRAKYLERGIESLLGKSLGGDFFNHNLIKSLRNDYALFQKRLAWKGLPSYVSGTLFVDTVLDWVHTGRTSSEAAPETDAATSTEPTATGPELRVAPKDELLSAIQSGIESAPFGKKSPMLRDAVLMYSRGAKDFDDFRKKMEAWYDETMQRVSGWYKRVTRLMVFSIGLVLVIAINADTLNVAGTLWHDAPLRASVADQAAAFAKKGTLETVQGQVELKNLEALKLPLGWKLHKAAPTDPRRLPHGWGWLIKLLGWFLTAIALTFGAPFWFDMLKKFVGLRSSGQEPQPAQTGPPSGAPTEPAKVEVTVKT